MKQGLHYTSATKFSLFPNLHKNVKSSDKEVKAEFDKIRKMYECYSYLYNNADDEPTRRKIRELASKHLLAKVDSIVLPAKMELRMRKEELRKLISVFEQ